MVLVMNVDRVLDCAAVSTAGVVSGKGAPTHNFVVLYGDRDGMFGVVVSEPVLTALEWLLFFLIGAGRVKDVMVVNVIDDLEVGFDGRTNSDGILVAS